MSTPKPLVTLNGLHVCIAVKNLDTSIEWYCQVLGFNVLQQKNFPELSARMVYLESQGVEIELVESKNIKSFERSAPPIAHLGIQGISQLSFRVNDLSTTMEQLKGFAIDILFGPVDAQELKLKAIFIRDNEGNII